jgi:HEPN domain-containing protein
MLKAHVCRSTGALAPKIHNLLRLAELAGLSISADQRVLLGQFNQYQLEGRYAGTMTASILPEQAKSALNEAEQMLQWLKKQF